MQKCTFKAVNHDGKAIGQIQIRANSYEQAVLEACEWFRGLKNRKGLHLITTAKFKDKNLPEDAFERVCKALNDACPGAYEGPRKEDTNERILPLLNTETLLVVAGSMMPEGVDFPYTGDNHTIYLWIDRRKGDHNLMGFVNERNHDGLIQELLGLHIAFIDLAGRCLHVKDSKSDKDILCYCMHGEAINRLRGLSLEKGQVISVSHAVEDAVKKLKIETKYCGLVRNPKKSDWYPIIDELLRANGIEPMPDDR